MENDPHNIDDIMKIENIIKEVRLAAADILSDKKPVVMLKIAGLSILIERANRFNRKKDQLKDQGLTTDAR